MLYHVAARQRFDLERGVSCGGRQVVSEGADRGDRRRVGSPSSMIFARVTTCQNGRTKRIQARQPGQGSPRGDRRFRGSSCRRRPRHRFPGTICGGHARLDSGRPQPARGCCRSTCDVSLPTALESVVRAVGRAVVASRGRSGSECRARTFGSLGRRLALNGKMR